MNTNWLDTNSTAQSASWFDKVIEWLMISLLAFMPFAFGAVEAWSELVVIFLAGSIAVCFALKLVFHRDTTFLWSWAYLPVGLFVLVAVFQLFPLPTAFVKTISPHTAALKTQLFGELPSTNTLISSMTVSFYPNATVHDLRLVLAIAVLFVVVLNIYRRPEQVKRLLAAIAVIGGMVALLALAQDLFGNGKIYWTVACYGKPFSGPFINHSHYGQFMNLSIGACLALLLVRLHEAFAGKKITPPAVFEYFSSPAVKLLWLLVAIIILGTATIFVSLSRGGMVSMLIAGGFTTLILTSRRSLKGRGWIIAIMALCAFACVLYIGFDAVYDRLATLRELHEVEGGRWQILKDISVAWTRFPLFGTGLGTHEVVYPMFDRSTIPAIAGHAENEYAQAAEETGLAGLVPLVLFAVIVWTAYVRGIRHCRLPVRSAAYGLGFGLLAIMIHSLSDFGQHVPANASLSAIFCALLLVLVRISDSHKEPARQASAHIGYFKPLRVCLLLVICGIFAWSLPSANRARVAESHWKQALVAEADLREKSWQASDQEYIELMKDASAAVDYQPDNAKYQHWLNVYRWRSISRVSDPNTGEAIIPQAAMKFVRQIVDELHKSIKLCPTFGPSWCLAGQLEMLVLNDPAGANHIRTGFRLAPCDATVCFVAGLLDAEEGKADESFEKFTMAVQLDGRLFTDVAGIYINQLNRPDLALTIAGDNISRLSHVANTLASLEEHGELAEQVRTQVTGLLKLKCQQPDVPAWSLASLGNIYRKENANADAIDCYRRALVLDYSQVYWRLNLAKLLAKTEQVPEAIHEARICLRLRPQYKAAEKLIADLSILPGAMREETSAP